MEDAKYQDEMKSINILSDDDDLERIPTGAKKNQIKQITTSNLTNLSNTISALKDNQKIFPDQEENCLVAIDTLQTKIQNQLNTQTDFKQLIDDCNDAVPMIKIIKKHIGDIVSGDPVKCIKASLDMVGELASKFDSGKFGIVSNAVFGLLSSVISLFGGTNDEASPTEILASVIEEALDDFKNDDINEKLKGNLLEVRMSMSVLHGISSYNGGKINAEVEGPILASLDYANVGIELMGALQYQVEHYKSTDDTKKQNYLPKYLYYYCKLFQLKRLLLMLQCSLLRTNGFESVYHGIYGYVNNKDSGILKEAHDFLVFLSQQPKPTEDFEWFEFYRGIHDPAILRPEQRQLIENALSVCGVGRMPGWIARITNYAVGCVCVIDIDDHNSKVLPGSFIHNADHGKQCYSLDNNDQHKTRIYKEQFTSLCNLYRGFNLDVLGRQNREYEFCLFSIAHGKFVFMSSKDKFNHELAGYNRTAYGNPDNDHISSMIFTTEGGVITDLDGNHREYSLLKGGLHRWRFVHCWVKPDGGYKAAFIGTIEDRPSGDDIASQFTFKYLKYDEYGINDTEIRKGNEPTKKFKRHK